MSTETLEQTMINLLSQNTLPAILEALNVALLERAESEPNKRKREQLEEYADIVAETVDAL